MQCIEEVKSDDWLNINILPHTIEYRVVFLSFVGISKKKMTSYHQQSIVNSVSFSKSYRWNGNEIQFNYGQIVKPLCLYLTLFHLSKLQRYIEKKHKSIWTSIGNNAHEKIIRIKIVRKEILQSFSEKRIEKNILCIKVTIVKSIFNLDCLNI